MDPLSATGSAVGIASLGLQVSLSLIDVYKAYKSQKSDIAHIVKKLERLVEVLESLGSQLADRKFRADEQELLGSIEMSIGDCQENIQELKVEADKFKSKSKGDGIRAAARTAAYRVSYPFRQSTLLKLEENIDETVSHLTLALNALSQKDISQIQDHVEDTNAVVNLMRADQVSREIRDWLKAPDATSNFQEACKGHAGTGLWFVNGEAFSNWLTEPHSFLWLHGFAGCGKSVLCATAIQHVYRYRRSNARIGIAIFFFKFDDESKQDASAMLRALILQLSTQLCNDYNALSSLHRTHGMGTPPCQALLDCLHRLVREFDHVYILLDALDESPQNKHRRLVLQTLTDMREWQELRLHILATSRDIISIREELDTNDRENISLRNDSVDRDIEDFVCKHLRANRALRKWENYFEEIKCALTTGAKGVFQWVVCQFLSLEQCGKSKTKLDILLTSLPETLHETYERMLLNIDQNSQEDARRVLHLLCCAKTPMSASEVIEAIAVELGDDPRLNVDARLFDKDELLRICPGLIEIDEYHFYEYDDDYQCEFHIETVRIAHYSVQEYLESGEMKDAVAKFSVKSSEAHAEIASVCVTYLLGLPQVREPLNQYPLTEYASQNWFKHFFEGDERVHQVKTQALRLFQDPKQALRIWACNLNRFEKLALDWEKGPSPLYFASFIGMEFVITELFGERPSGDVPLEIQTQINEETGYYGNALQAASANGHETVVQLLLRMGARVNARGGHHGTALCAAAACGRKNIVELLLESGAAVNAQGGFYGNALYAASAICNEFIVKLLLDRNADVAAKGGSVDKNALYIASERGHEAIVKLLLDRNADVNAGRGYFGNALQAASECGHESIVRLLLDRNADVNAEGGYYGNALQAASGHGHEAIVKLLLDKNADVNAESGIYGGTSLYIASECGHEAIVRLLLDKNADINARSGFFGSALQAASGRGHEAIVKLLLDRNADINAEGGTYGGNALCIASERGHEAIVRLLLDRNADINARSGVFSNALQAASEHGQEAIIKLLLEKKC